MMDVNLKKLLGKNGVVKVRFKTSNGTQSAKSYTYFLPSYISAESIKEGSEVLVDSPYNGLTVVKVESVHPYDFTQVQETTKPVVSVVNTEAYENWQNEVQLLQTKLLQRELDNLRKEVLGNRIYDTEVNRILGFDNTLNHS